MSNIISEYNNALQILVLLEDEAEHQACCCACPRHLSNEQRDQNMADWDAAYNRLQIASAELVRRGVSGYGPRPRKNPYLT